jgi:hypothetical protein
VGRDSVGGRATPSRCGRSSARFLGICRGAASTCGCNTLGLSPAAHARATASPTRRQLKPASECQPIAYPRPSTDKLNLRPADRRSFCRTTQITRKIRPPHLHVADMGRCKRRPEARRLCRSVGALLPGRRSTSGSRRRRPAALRDQRSELCTLQNLRHQRSKPQHHLGAARVGAAGRNIPIFVDCGSLALATIPPHGESLG